jgi:hypothetical protein
MAEAFHPGTRLREGATGRGDGESRRLQPGRAGLRVATSMELVDGDALEGRFLDKAWKAKAKDTIVTYGPAVIVPAAHSFAFP